MVGNPLQMERKNSVLVFLIFACGIIIFMSITNLPLNKEVIPAKFVLGENMGFDLTPGKLNFGKIVPGYGASRDVMVENNYDEIIKVNIKSSGEISDSLIVSENNFVLNPLESRSVAFSIYTGGLTEYRSYEGKVIITSRVVN